MHILTYVETMEQVRGQQSTIYTVCGAKTLVEALGPFGQTIQTTSEVGGYCCFQQQLQEWDALEVKNYKIRVISPKDPSMQVVIEGYDDDTDITWAGLDNRPLKFLNDSRPRARYLYFAYCEAIFSQCFTQGKHLDTSRAEVGKRYWGTPGRYFLKSMLLGFVEQMGHNYDHLLEGAIDDDAKPRSEAVILAAEHLKRVNETMPDGRKLVEEEEEEEDEDKDVEDLVV